jgi:hypothetical protein
MVQTESLHTPPPLPAGAAELKTLHKIILGVVSIRNKIPPQDDNASPVRGGAARFAKNNTD